MGGDKVEKPEWVKNLKGTFLNYHVDHNREPVQTSLKAYYERERAARTKQGHSCRPVRPVKQPPLSSSLDLLVAQSGCNWRVIPDRFGVPDGRPTSPQGAQQAQQQRLQPSPDKAPRRSPSAPCLQKAPAFAETGPQTDLPTIWAGLPLEEHPQILARLTLSHPPASAPSSDTRLGGGSTGSRMRRFSFGGGESAAPGQWPGGGAPCTPPATVPSAEGAAGGPVTFPAFSGRLSTPSPAWSGSFPLPSQMVKYPETGQWLL